jgi:hypothetical protein
VSSYDDDDVLKGKGVESLPPLSPPPPPLALAQPSAAPAFVALMGRARSAQLRRQMAGSVAAARTIGGAPPALLTAGALRLLADWLGDAEAAGHASVMRACLAAADTPPPPHRRRRGACSASRSPAAAASRQRPPCERRSRSPARP